VFEAQTLKHWVRRSIICLQTLFEKKMLFTVNRSSSKKKKRGTKESRQQCRQRVTGLQEWCWLPCYLGTVIMVYKFAVALLRALEAFSIWIWWRIMAPVKPIAKIPQSTKQPYFFHVEDCQCSYTETPLHCLHSTAKICSNRWWIHLLFWQSPLWGP